MHRYITRVLVALAAAAGLVSGAGTALASPSDPTVGDTVTYYFFSDQASNASSNWYDGNNDMQSFDHTRLPARNEQGRWYGTQSFRSASTYQLTGASIQTEGYWAGCRILVNGVQVDQEFTSGHYTIATCAG